MTLLGVFLCGDVMPGRGIDQILPHPLNPGLREAFVKDARAYVRLAEKENGPIDFPVDFSWPWGEALPTLDKLAPDVRLINLETSITMDGTFAPGKAVHYRMSPDNLACLTVARPDVCAFANNHVLDFGHQGLTDTLDALARAGLRGAGAGLNAHEAQSPAVVTTEGRRRVVFFSGGMESSGIPRRWAATLSRSGVSFIPDLSNRSAAEIAMRVQELKQPGDITVVSLHWGSNWGYDISDGQVRFAHRLVDAGVDIIHGHSSHHPRPIEIYRNKLILYGCGDLINDYEGIKGYEAYRPDLRLLYFAYVDSDSGELACLHIVPMQARNLRLRHASSTDAEWLRSTLEHASRRYGTGIDCNSDDMLTVRLK
jgi:poly-gamma-glutamate capsule biosynthesis protein CapA/YwtB (metallophosphatase superfamily)